MMNRTNLDTLHEAWRVLERHDFDAGALDEQIPAAEAANADERIDDHPNARRCRSAARLRLPHGPGAARVARGSSPAASTAGARGWRPRTDGGKRCRSRGARGGVAL